MPLGATTRRPQKYRGIRPEKKLVRPSGGGLGGGTTGTPVRNRERPGARGSRTGGVTDRTLKAKPYKPPQRMEKYEGRGELMAKRLRKPETPPSREQYRPTPMMSPQMGQPTLAPQPIQMQPPIQPEQPMPQPVQPVQQPGFQFPNISQFSPFQPSLYRPQPMPQLPYPQQPYPQQPSLYGAYPQQMPGYGMEQRRFSPMYR